MIPFDVNMGDKKRVGISFESLVWFFVVTAAATVVGELVYEKWVQPYLANLPSLPGSTTAPAALPPAGNNSNGNVLQFPGGMSPNGNGSWPS
jgi:hypothetical protein